MTDYKILEELIEDVLFRWQHLPEIDHHQLREELQRVAKATIEAILPECYDKKEWQEKFVDDFKHGWDAAIIIEKARAKKWLEGKQ